MTYGCLPTGAEPVDDEVEPFGQHDGIDSVQTGRRHGAIVVALTCALVRDTSRPADAVTLAIPPVDGVWRDLAVDEHEGPRAVG